MAGLSESPGLFRGTTGLWSGHTGLIDAGTVDLDFTSGSLPGGVTLTRASTGTYTNSSGLLATAAIDAARFTYSTTAIGTILGLLIEPQRTNLVTRSQEFDNAAWTITAGSMTADQANAPDGTLTADLFSEDGTSASNHGPNHLGLSVGASTTYAASGFFKYIGRRWIRFHITDGVVVVGLVWFDIQNGIVGSHSFTTGTFVSASIVQSANGFYRCVAVFATAAASSTSVQFRIWGSAADGDAGAYTGLNGPTTYYWGAQLEAGASASSYIPTTAAQVTRSADAASFTVPAGVATLRDTFDDLSTQDVSASAGSYTVPTNLNRPIIRGIASL